MGEMREMIQYSGGCDVLYIVMYLLKRSIIWLRRICYCRGFGVQSPNDYAFIRYVINEHYPYYAYSDMRKVYPGIGKECRRVCELYFRIANFVQPAVILNFYGDPYYERYLRVGSVKADIVNRADTLKSTEGKLTDSIISAAGQKPEVSLAIMPLTGNYHLICERLISKGLGDRSVLILHGINRNGETKRFWRSVMADNRTGVTFDLYYLGIVFFDLKRYKHNYKVNF